MSREDKKKGTVKGVIINSVGAALACQDGKKESFTVVLAYSKGRSNGDIRFLTLKASRKTALGRDDFLDAIREAEDGACVTYVDFDGKDKDIYVCRPKEGDVYDFVARDDVGNRYNSGFAEIEASNLKFSVGEIKMTKIGKPLEAEVMFSNSGAEYPQNSLEYAVVNSYNACLLGKVFSRDEFQLETGDGSRVKYEVRSFAAKYVDLSALYVRPECNEGDNFVSAYITEPMNVINGDEMITRVYKIAYRASFDDYNLERIQ